MNNTQNAPEKNIETSSEKRAEIVRLARRAAEAVQRLREEIESPESPEALRRKRRRERQRRWYDANRDRWNAYMRAYYARRKAAKAAAAKEAA